MAITYLSGQRVQGSSTSAVTSDYTSDFTSCSTDGNCVGWDSSDTTKFYVDVSDDKYFFNVNASYKSSEFDFDDATYAPNVGTLTTKYVVRWKMKFTALSGGGVYWEVGMSDTTGERNANQYLEGLHLQSNKLRLVATPTGTAPEGTTGDDAVDLENPFTFNTTDTLYFELKRDGSSLTLTRYTEDTYTTVGATVTHTILTSGAISAVMRYFRIITNNTATDTGHVWDVKFWNNVTSTTQNDKTTVTDVPVGSQFEETDTRRFYQYGGGGNDGLGSSADMTNSGGTQDITGEIGKAWYTGTSGGYTYAGSTNADWVFMNTTDCKFSIAFWCKLASSGNSPVDGDLLLGTGNGESEVGIAIRCNGTGGSIGLHVYGSAEIIAAYTSSGFIQEDGNWHHYVFTYDQTLGSSNLKMYKDGGTAVTGNKSNDSTSTSSPAHVFSLGGGLGNDFKGNFDEVSVWNRVLTSGEVDFLYDNDGGGTAQVTTAMSDLTSLKAYWNLDETSGTYANSAVGWVERGTAI